MGNISIDLPVNDTKGVVNITLPKDATGNVTVLVDGKVYNVTNLTEGSVLINITNIMPGNHTVEVIYSGDGNYTPISNVTDWTIGKLNNYTITADSINITEGQTEDIYIDIDIDDVEEVTIALYRYDDARGRWKLVRSYAEEINDDREGCLELDGLTEGKYKAVVKYKGDDLYAGQSNETFFTVKAKANSSVVGNISIDLPVNDTKGVVNVTLPENATGNVTVIVDGKVYDVTNLTR